MEVGENIEDIFELHPNQGSHSYPKAASAEEWKINPLIFFPL